MTRGVSASGKIYVMGVTNELMGSELVYLKTAPLTTLTFTGPIEDSSRLKRSEMERSLNRFSFARRYMVLGYDMLRSK